MVRRGFWRRHSLSLTLIAIFAAFTAATLILGWSEFAAEQSAHNEQVSVGQFWRWWVFEYAMSLVADVFGAILLVTLTKRLREIGSAEDKES